MTDTPSRLFGLLLVMVAIWIGVYWLWEPSDRIVTIDPRPPLAGDVEGPRPGSPVLAPSVDVPRTDLLPLPVRPPVVEAPSEARKATEAASGPVPSGKPATRKVARVIRPEFRAYTVQAGDISWERIAARREVYGDRRLWRAVAQANPLTTSDRLRAGVKLKIAVDPENNQEGKTVWVDEPVPGSARSAGGSGAKAEVTYEIKGDDTLWSIARQFYGSGANWRKIYDANREVIKNPDRPPTGAMIRIPAKDDE